MKILYISQALLPSEISNSLSTMKMCQAFHDSGHEVALLGRRPTKAEVDIASAYGLPGGFSIKTFYNSGIKSRFPFKDILYGLKLRRYIKKEKPDVIYSRFCLLSLHLISTNTPLVYEMHSPGPLGKSILQRILFRALIKRKIVKRIIVTTNVLKKYLKKTFPSTEIVLARLSAEKPVFLTPNKVINFKRSELKCKNNFAVGYTGFLDNYGLRGTDIICKLAKRMQNIDFHVVGGTPDMVEYWSKRADSENIFFYGHKPSNLIPFYLKSFDVVLAPLQLQKLNNKSFAKGMSPLKISQYLSYGCAIVASDISAHREILENKKNALLVEYNNIEEWVKAITRLQDNQELRNTLQHNAYKRYIAELTPEIRVNIILDGIKNI